MLPYLTHLFILVGIYLILAQAFNLPFGIGRLFNLAHVAAYALGAYTTALLATECGTLFFLCILASMLLSGLFAILVGGISLRLTSDYFAIGTLAFSSVISSLLINWREVTRGVLGIPGIPRPEIGQIDFYENLNFIVLLYVFVLFVQLVCYLLISGPYGRTLRALAEFEQAALAIGKQTRIARIASFFIASSLAGLAGSFFAYYINYIDPSSFALHEMIFVLTIVVVGRPGSFWGTIAASIFLVLLPEPLRFIDIPASILGPMRQLLYAIILFGVVFYNRKRLFPPERTI